jgi:subtilase family serine protease
MACDALVRTDLGARGGRGPHPRFAATAAPDIGGYGPVELRAAYSLPSAPAGAGETVALVEAYHDPDAASDLAVYRANYDLPPCDRHNGCLNEIDENGGSDLPTTDPGWAGETAADMDMVSAVCPACHILLVEAATPSARDLAQAEDTAVRAGADAISNSYGGPESPHDQALTAAYIHPGVAITAASGDDGYGVAFPASSPGVTAVGGTTLLPTERGWEEQAWSGGGSGCSAEPRPSWQPATLCAHRSTADVAAVADPATGVAVYDSYQSTGWQIVGGTSVGAPLIAAVYALAGNTSQVDGAKLAYADPAALHDIRAGANGVCGSALCQAGPGYDGPTGLGSPNGLGAF